MQLERIENLQDAVVTVMGLGRYKQGSGYATATWLIKHGAQTVITDLKSEGDLREAMGLIMEWYRAYHAEHADKTVYQPVFVLGEHRKEDFLNVDCVVQNPGVPSEAEFADAAKAAGIHIESDASLFMRFYPHPVIAVTGTKGKTTTTMLLGEMLKAMHKDAVVAGNVKASPLMFLDDLLLKNEEIPVVLEFSSWMLQSVPGAFQEMGRGPDIAVLTNVYPDHLDRYENYEAYKASKEIIFQHQRPDQISIFNKDHDDVRAMAAKAPSKKLWFSAKSMTEDGCSVENGVITYRRDGKTTAVVPLADVMLKGEHNVSNALAAACAALVRGVPVAAVAETLKTFAGVPDRQELVREVDEITYINDVASTSPDSTEAALKTLGGSDRRVILIAGGEGKGASFDALAGHIAQSCKAIFLLPGSASDALEKALLGKLPIDHVKTMRDAVQHARKTAVRGDTVLLSPAAAASSLFANEYEEGEEFREEVRNL